MIEKFISPGDKIEMTPIMDAILPEGTEGVRTYRTTIHDVMSEGRLQIVMPLEHTKLILLPIDAEYDVRFYSKGGIYRSTLRVTDRFKSEGLYIVTAELTSNLHKFQRREYYRFNCIVDVNARQLAPPEIDNLRKGIMAEAQEAEMESGIIVDISGGGTRFVSDYRFEEDSDIVMKFKLSIMDIEKPFILIAKVLYSNVIENRPDMYENRVKFEYINNTTREEIIKYIFDEERKNRKNSKGR